MKWLRRYYYKFYNKIKNWYEFESILLNIIYLPDDEAAIGSSERANTADNKIRNFIVHVQQCFNPWQRIQTDFYWIWLKRFFLLSWFYEFTFLQIMFCYCNSECYCDLYQSKLSIYTIKLFRSQHFVSIKYQKLQILYRQKYYHYPNGPNFKYEIKYLPGIFRNRNDWWCNFAPLPSVKYLVFKPNSFVSSTIL